MIVDVPKCGGECTERVGLGDDMSGGAPNNDISVVVPPWGQKEPFGEHGDEAARAPGRTRVVDPFPSATEGGKCTIDVGNVAVYFLETHDIHSAEQTCQVVALAAHALFESMAQGTRIPRTNRKGFESACKQFLGRPSGVKDTLPIELY